VTATAELLVMYPAVMIVLQLRSLSVYYP